MFTGVPDANISLQKKRNENFWTTYRSREASMPIWADTKIVQGRPFYNIQYFCLDHGIATDQSLVKSHLHKTFLDRVWYRLLLVNDPNCLCGIIARFKYQRPAVQMAAHVSHTKYGYPKCQMRCKQINFVWILDSLSIQNVQQQSDDKLSM